MMDWKYIIIEHEGMEVPILFPPIIYHETARPVNANVVAAGFCRIVDDGHIVVRGGSRGLGAESRAEDADIIQHALSFEGVG